MGIITVEKARRILGKMAEDMTDEAIINLIGNLEAIASAALQMHGRVI